MTYAFKYINLIPYMLIWVMFDCRYKLDQIGVSYFKLKGAKEKKIGAEPQSSRLNWNPVDWILRQKLQTSILEESNRLDGNLGDWIN